MKHLGVIHVFILFYYICGGPVRCENGYSRSLRKEQDVKVSQKPGNDHDRFPETFSLWFQHGSDLEHFQLSRDNVVTPTLSPVLFRLSNYLPNDLMNDDNVEDFAFYHTGNSPQSKLRAHFVVYRPETSLAATFYGQIISDDNIFRVIPKEIGTENYKLIQDLKTDAQRSSLTEKDNIIELLVWIAPDLYDFHYRRLSSQSDNVDEWLQTYAKSLIRDVDRIFRHISTTSVQVYFVGAGFDKNMENADWFTSNTNGHVLYANAAWEDVTAYLANRAGNGLIPRYDHAIALTRKLLAGSSNNKHILTTAHGNKKSMCSGGVGSSVSLASVGSPSFLSAIVRSIAIGLGADAEEDVHATNAAEYMNFDSKKDTQKLKLSAFGEIKLTRHLMTLARNCLHYETNEVDFHDLLNSPSLGDLSLKEQCEIVFGSEAFECEECRFGNCLKQGEESSGKLSVKDGSDEVPVAQSTMTILSSTLISTITPPTYNPSSIDPTGITSPAISSFEPFTATSYEPMPPTVQPPRPPEPITDTTTTPGNDVIFMSSSTIIPSISTPTEMTNPTGMSSTSQVLSSFAPSTPTTPEEKKDSRACECCRQCRCREACDRCPQRPAPPSPPKPPLKCRGRGGCCKQKSSLSSESKERNSIYNGEDGP